MGLFILLYSLGYGFVLTIPLDIRCCLHDILFRDFHRNPPRPVSAVFLGVNYNPCVTVMSRRRFRLLV